MFIVMEKQPYMVVSLTQLRPSRVLIKLSSQYDFNFRIYISVRNRRDDPWRKLTTDGPLQGKRN